MSQSTSTPHSNINSQEDETTPLISIARSVPPPSVYNPFSEQRRASIRNSLPSFSFLRAPSLDSDDEDDDAVDVDALRLSLAKINSLPSAIGLEPARVPYARANSLSVPSEVDEVEVDDEPEEATKPAEDVLEDSKFIGISPKRFWMIFAVIMLAYFVACFDSTLMASAHPVITSYFHASQAASWLSTVFLITSTGFQPLFGRLSDTVGRKPVFMVSLALFALTTLWCALAGSIESFIAARAVCGLGAGGTMSLSMIILSDLVRIEDRGVFQSHINFSFGLGSASGAALGGFLCDTLGWRWAFGIQVPFLLAGFVAAWLFTPHPLGPHLIKADADHEGGAWEALRDFDSTGSTLLLTAVTFLILALNLGGNIFPWLSGVVIGSFIIFAVSTILFAYVESRAKQAVMPLRLLTKAPIANMVAANFLGGIASNTVLFNVPIFFQAVLLTSASASGFRLAVPSLVGSAAGISTGYIITYTRRLKPTLVAGVIIYLIGAIAISFISAHTGELLSLILITGVPLGQGFVFPNTMMSALAVSAQRDQAVVTTTIGLWRSLGVVMGVAVSSLVFQNCLVVNLEKMVMGPEKDEIIRLARSSVKMIRSLEPPYQSQVISAYAAALRTSFLAAVVAAVLMVVIVLPIKLPQLRRGRKIVVGAGE